MGCGGRSDIEAVDGEGVFQVLKDGAFEASRWEACKEGFDLSLVSEARLGRPLRQEGRVGGSGSRICEVGGADGGTVCEFMCWRCIF